MLSPESLTPPSNPPLPPGETDPGRPADPPVHNRRVAVFGGSFDPIHNGHLYMAGEILRRDLADEVLFVPAKRPPHKLDIQLSAACHRLAMIEAAIAPFPRFSVSDIEIQRSDETPSYTIDTLETLRAVYPEAALLFILGMDSLAELHHWRRAGELVSRFDFIVFHRPGISPPAASELSGRFGWKNGRKLMASIVDTPSVPIAAKEIRQLHRVGKSLAGLAPESVLDYIRSHRLYLPDGPEGPIVER